MSGRSVAPHLRGLTPEQLSSMFPDGNIPQTPPKRTLGSKFRTSRSKSQPE